MHINSMLQLFLLRFQSKAIHALQETFLDNSECFTEKKEGTVIVSSHTLEVGLEAVKAED